MEIKLRRCKFLSWNARVDFVFGIKVRVKRRECVTPGKFQYCIATGTETDTCRIRFYIRFYNIFMRVCYLLASLLQVLRSWLLFQMV